MQNLYVVEVHPALMKYAPLGNYLDSLDADERQIDIKGIERILGFELPKKSSRHKSFWSNNRSGKAQAGPGWLNVGWRVKSLRHERGKVSAVTFRRAPDSETGGGPSNVTLTDEDKARMRRPNLETQRSFYYSAGDHMMNEHSQALRQGETAGVNHRFDFVSDDGKIVGEMRLIKSVPARGIHSATLASISEAVFFLQHARAQHRFIVFGGDQRVPEAWLARHAGLADGVAFYYIRHDGELLTLQPAPSVRVANARRSERGSP